MIVFIKMTISTDPYLEVGTQLYETSNIKGGSKYQSIFLIYLITGNGSS